MNQRLRRGMTLVEMLVATAMTLLIMGIVAQLFGLLATTLNRSRDAIKMSTDARSVANLLRRDLAGLTARTVPPLSADADAGYLEIIEGPASDKSGGTTTLNGDCDDGLLLTTRSLDQPFVGRFGTSGSLESPVAEVVWFCLPSPSTYQTIAGSTLYTLYRRQLLVTDYVGQTPFENGGGQANSYRSTYNAALQQYDISLRNAQFLPANGGIEAMRPNSLSDLTRREWRFQHHRSGGLSATAFPYNGTASNIPNGAALTGTRQGEDIVLTNVLAFDVRVFDPRAPLRQTAAMTAVDPSDPGYASAAAAGATGAYVDLGSGGAATTLMGAANAASQVTNIYDTWSTHYEFNGIDEDRDGAVDEGTNGRDDDGNGIVDDAAEQETAPPYPVALRGIEVRIRCYEPESRQVRQITVRHTFVPH
jgi:hypothetical protein